MSKHTDAEIEAAARRFEAWADALDPAKLEEVSDLRDIAIAASTVRADEARLREAVQVARERGHSWNRIGVALGVSRQAARERYAEWTPACFTVSLTIDRFATRSPVFPNSFPKGSKAPVKPGNAAYPKTASGAFL